MIRALSRRGESFALFVRLGIERLLLLLLLLLHRLLFLLVLLVLLLLVWQGLPSLYMLMIFEVFYGTIEHETSLWYHSDQEYESTYAALSGIATELFFSMLVIVMHVFI